MSFGGKAVLAITLLLAACGPIDPRIAADQCEERARQAAGLFGEIQVGGGTQGARGSIEIGITSDYIRGRDPYEVYDTCVREKTGQGPIRPLALRR
jgi:hypothetical protein